MGKGSLRKDKEDSEINSMYYNKIKNGLSWKTLAIIDTDIRKEQVRNYSNILCPSKSKFSPLRLLSLAGSFIDFEVLLTLFLLFIQPLLPVQDSLLYILTIKIFIDSFTRNNKNFTQLGISLISPLIKKHHGWYRHFICAVYAGKDSFEEVESLLKDIELNSIIKKIKEKIYIVGGVKYQIIPVLVIDWACMSSIHANILPANCVAFRISISYVLYSFRPTFLKLLVILNDFLNTLWKASLHSLIQ